MAVDRVDEGIVTGQTVTAADVNRNFGDVQERAKKEPVIVTHHGRPRLAILSMEDYQRLLSHGENDEGASHRKLGIILDSIREGYISIDTDWRIMTVNRVAELFLGRTREELVGRSWHETFRNTSAPSFEPQLRRVFDHGQVVNFEALSMLHAGRIVDLQAFPLPGPAGGVGILFFNISEARRNEEVARELEARVQSMLSLLDDRAVVGVNRDEKLFLWNKHAQHIFGWREDEVNGQPLSRLLSSEDDGLLRHMRSLPSNGPISKTASVPGVHKSGRALSLDAAVAGTPSGWIVMFSEIRNPAP